MRGYWHLFAGAFLLGGLTFSHQRDTSIIYLVLLLGWLFYIFPSKRLIVLMVAAFVTGGLFTSTDYTNSPAIADTTLHGKLVSTPKVTDNKIEVIMKLQDTSQKILLTAFKEHNSSSTPPSFAENWKYGAVCQINAPTSFPPAATNPGEFDYRTYLLQQGIISQIIITDKTEIDCIGHSWVALLDAQRYKLLSQYETKLSPEISPWLKALIFGETSDLEKTTIQLFQRWNLSHLLAISGLHVGLIIGFILYVLTRSGIITTEKSYWLLFTLLPLYAFFAGGAPSVLRAVAMAMLGMLVIKFSAKVTVTDILSILLLCFLLINPSYLHQLGFQFSFLVTFSLLFSLKWFKSTSSNLVLLMQISLLSQLILLPIQLVHFFQFNPLSVFANLIYVPYFTIIVIPMMLFLSILTIFLPAVAVSISEPFLYLHHFSLEGLRYMDSHLYYPWIAGRITPLYSLVYYIFLVLMLASLQVGNRRRAFLSAVVAVFVLVFFSIKPYMSKEGTVSMLDVGQGDSFVIELPYRKGVFIIDAAGTSHFSANQERIADNIIIPFLHSKGISKVDAVFLSHEDSDHIGSIPFLFDDLQIDKLLVSPYFQFPDAMQKQVLEHNIPVIRLKRNEVISLSGQVFKVLNPGGNYNDANDNSLVLFTTFGGWDWLFAGDISDKVEGDLMKVFPDLRADVLKASHHGSKTSSSESFLVTLKGKVVLISAGRNNRYGHPHEEVLERMETLGLTTLRTDIHGAVQFVFEESKGNFYIFNEDQ
nr:DNA internalization-related competence protein ComEC/Rec2 [Thalassobacillus devorans]